MLDLTSFLANTLDNARSIRPVQGPLNFNELASALATKDACGASPEQEIRESWVRGFRRWG